MTNEHTSNVLDELTTVLLTHYSPRESYGSLAPPSTGIVSETVASATEKIDALGKSEIEVYYFQPPDRTDHADEYLDNLQQYVERSAGITLYTGVNEGLRRNLVKVLDRIDTRYTFFIEHDWRFLEEANLIEILETMEAYPKVNYVRFNMYENVVKRWNTVVEPDPELPVPMCKGASFTNQPHVSERVGYPGHPDSGGLDQSPN